MIRLNPKYIPLLATAIVLVAVFGTGTALYPNFGTPRVFVNLLNDNAFVGVAAIGESFVILSGGIDLSVGSMVAFVGILIAKLLQAGCDPFLAMGIALCAGTLSGAIMGCLIYFFEMPPFLVTLAGLFCLRGLGFVIYPESIGIDHPFYSQMLPQLSDPRGSKSGPAIYRDVFPGGGFSGYFYREFHPLWTQRLCDRVERKLGSADGLAHWPNQNLDLRACWILLRGWRRSGNVLHAVR